MALSEGNMRPIIWKALYLMRMPGYAERFRRQQIRLLEKRLHYIDV